MRATLHLVNREFEALADDFVTLGMLPKAEVRAVWQLGGLCSPSTRSLVTLPAVLPSRLGRSPLDSCPGRHLPPPQGDEKASIVPALTGVFEEALRGGVSNLSFGELSGNLGEGRQQWG